MQNPLLHVFLMKTVYILAVSSLRVNDKWIVLLYTVMFSLVNEAPKTNFYGILMDVS